MRTKMMRTKTPHTSPSGSGAGRQGSRGGDADKKGDESSTRHQYNFRGKREALGNIDLNRRELRLERFGWDGFEVTNALGQGRCGNVFEGTLRGEKVVIKLCDLWQHPELHKEMLREARTYVELGKLQGHGIPKLKGVGYTAGGLFALMTEFAGWPIKAENLDDKKRQMIVGVLASIHAEGFLHGDLRCENILIEHYNDDPRITFIDFGFARKFSNHKQSESEMAALRKMIGFRSMKKPRIE
jgi:serine/threonine protein kinase